MRSLLLDFRASHEKQPRGNHELTKYVDKLLSAFIVLRQQPQSSILPAKSKAEKPNLIEPLSQRELEILRLLQTELSVPEIAR